MKPAPFAYARAKSVEHAIELLARPDGEARLLAGGQSLIATLNMRLSAPKLLIDLNGVNGLAGIAIKNGMVEIGALTRHAEAERSADIVRHAPLIALAMPHIGHAAIRNRGTLGGNIANSSPAADSLPALLVYETELELVSTQGARWVAYRDFHTGYKTTVMRTDELISAIRLPRVTADWQQYARKVGTRKAQAISKVCFAGMAQVEAGTIKDIRLAFGSVAPVPVRALATENVLQKQKVDQTMLKNARTTLLNELKPIDDMRSTADYRAHVAGNLLEEFLRQLS